MPYWVVELRSETELRLLAGRSVSLRHCVELWGRSDTLRGLHEQVREYARTESDCRGYFEEDVTFLIDVDTFRRHFSQREKLEKVEVGVGVVSCTLIKENRVSVTCRCAGACGCAAPTSRSAAWSATARGGSCAPPSSGAGQVASTADCRVLS